MAKFFASDREICEWKTGFTWEAGRAGVGVMLAPIRAVRDPIRVEVRVGLKTGLKLRVIINLRSLYN